MAEEFDDIEELARRFLIIQANYLAASNRPPASDTSRAVEASPAEHKSDAAVNGGRVWDGHASTRASRDGSRRSDEPNRRRSISPSTGFPPGPALGTRSTSIV